MSDDKKVKSDTAKKPLNEERGEKSYTTSHLDDKLSSAGKNGSGGKASTNGKSEG